MQTWAVVRGSCCSNANVRHHWTLQVFLDAVGQFTGDAGDSQDPVATFDTVQVLAPRGRFSIELYSTYLKLVGQARCNP